MGLEHSMYYPYFRGKQYELVTVRESASLIARSGFVPIIEPVREQTSGLRKALESLAEHSASSIVILNPQIGDHSDDGKKLRSFIADNFGDYQQLQSGFLLTEDMNTDDVIAACNSSESNRNIALIHAGFSEAKALANRIPKELSNVSTNVFSTNDISKV